MLRNHIFLISIVLLVVCFFPTIPPFSFPSGSIVTVPEGAGLYTLAEKLEQDNVIRSPFWFRTIAIVLGGERNMKAGQYLMSKPQDVFTIVWRVFHGDYDIKTIKLTIPEGFTVKKISALFGNEFILFDHPDFESRAPEGYLFPDTYFIQVSATASSTIKLLNDNFLSKISPIISEIESSGRTLEEIISMASIIESEAKFKEDREIISGILWKRIKLGIPLQVDSDPDTYKHLGFPPAPISNPGLESIDSALYPAKSPYLYFLTDKEGKMHYAKTFNEHKRNIAKYLTQ